MQSDGRLTYAEAANAALRRALDERAECLVFGEDVALPGGVFGVTKGLRRSYGNRVFDTPISETAMLGAAVGAALVGMRPIVEIMWMDFALVAFDQIVNQAANARYVSCGRLSAPLTIRTQQGSQPGACAQHSQSLEALLTHIPGIRVCLPSTAQEAYDLLIAAVWCDDPVVVIENRNLYFAGRHRVRTGGAVQAAFGAAIRRPGPDVTLLSWGAMVGQALAAADRLAAEGIGVEVIDARWLSPFDMATVLGSVRKTGRLVVAHEANLTGAFSAQVVASVAEAGEQLRHPPVRIGAPDVRMPAAPSLISAVIPDADLIAASIRRMARSEAG